MKSIIIASTLLLGLSSQAVASSLTYHRSTLIERQSCTDVPSRDAGYIKSEGFYRRIIAPAHKSCSWVPTTRIRTRSHYTR